MSARLVDEDDFEGGDAGDLKSRSELDRSVSAGRPDWISKHIMNDSSSLGLHLRFLTRGMSGLTVALNFPITQRRVCVRSVSAYRGIGVAGVGITDGEVRVKDGRPPRNARAAKG